MTDSYPQQLEVILEVTDPSEDRLLYEKAEDLLDHLDGEWWLVDDLQTGRVFIVTDGGPA